MTETERVARAIFDAHEADLDLPERWQWDDATEAVRGYYRRLAEAAVSAMTHPTAPPDPHTAGQRRTTQEESTDE